MKYLLATRKLRNNAKLSNPDLNPGTNPDPHPNLNLDTNLLLIRLFPSLIFLFSSLLHISSGLPSNDPIVSTLKSKNLKARPHENPLLSKYKYTVYLDTKLTVTEAHVLSVLTDLPSGKYIAMNKHRFFTGNNISVWKDYHESLNQERYAKGKNKMKNYIEKKLEQGYPESKETYLRSGFIVRDMTQSIVKEVGEVWYRNILECGIL